MIVKQLIQFFIFPKSFNVLSFYSKGHYSLRIRLTAEEIRTEKIIRAFPVLVQGKEAKKQEFKRATVNEEDAYYQSEHFYVTFSEQKIIFNTACIFKLEYTYGREYRTYIDFELVCTSLKKQQRDSGEQIIRKVSISDRRRIYINSTTSLNTFKRILFDDVDYFSFSDVYMISQTMGDKIRTSDYQLLEFNGMDMQSRQERHHDTFEREMQLGINKNKSFRQIFSESTEEFYVRMITEKLLRYGKLYSVYQKLIRIAGPNIMQGRQLQLSWMKVDDFHRQSELMQLYETQDVAELFMRIYQQSHQIMRNVKYVWQLTVQLLLSINFNVIDQLACLEVASQQHNKAKWLLSYSVINEQEREQQRQVFLKKRADILNKMNVYEDMDIYHPFLMIQNRDPQEVVTKQRLQVDSLVVLVHGYQGSGVDLQKARNFMNIYNPWCYGLLVKSIQDFMDESIEKLGEMVADEVMQQLLKTQNNYKAINFIGYSLGGIVAREAVKHLQKYKHLMNVFVSFASPHAGICDASNPLVKTGIWFLTNFQKNKNLKQLNCERNQLTQDITLQNLSVCQGLSWFNRFVVVSSRQDGFVPYESSRLQEQNLKEMTKDICLNIKQRIRKLQRVEVWFDVEHCVGTLDRMTGRRSHIEFLQNRMFLDCFFSVYAPLL